MKLILIVILFLTTLQCYGQENRKDSGLKPLDLMLTNYEYPYPVQHLTISTQQQELEMAYMDVKPGSFNGKAFIGPLISFLKE